MYILRRKTARRGKSAGLNVILPEAGQPFRPAGRCMKRTGVKWSVLRLQRMKVKIVCTTYCAEEVLNWCRLSSILGTRILRTLLHLGMCRLASLLGTGANAVLSNLQKYHRFFWAWGVACLWYFWVAVTDNASKALVPCLSIILVAPATPCWQF